MGARISVVVAQYVRDLLHSLNLPWAMLVFSPIKVDDSREAPIDGIFASLLLIWTMTCILQDTGFNWGSDKPIILTKIVTLVLILGLMNKHRA